MAHDDQQLHSLHGQERSLDWPVRRPARPLAGLAAEPIGHGATRYRREIDGLRALAVLPVLLFHAGFSGLPGGFAGVDVFFVISGFLITTIIQEEIVEKKFSLVGFYERRARRILPALLLVSFACIPFAMLWMLPRELDSFGKSLYAANLSVSNFMFWNQTDYFSPKAELMPLLHTWSLGVEEQFYAIFPLLALALFRLPRLVTLAVITSLAAASFSATQHIGYEDPLGNFFLLPSRFWELAMGAILAVSGLARFPVPQDVRGLLAAVGLFAVVASYILVPQSRTYPGWTTVPVIAGTLLVLAFARPDTMVGYCLAWPPLVLIGLCSYSLYLWHQPIFAFARMRSLGEVTPWGYAALTALCFVLAYLTTQYIEKPFRRNFGRRAVFVLCLSATSIIIVIGLGLDKSNGLANQRAQFTRLIEPSLGLGKKCDGVVDPSCGTNPEPEMAVWGDSYARHLVEGIIASNPDARLVQLTRNSCGPFLGLAPYMPTLDADWPKECIDHNMRVQEYLLASTSVRYVIVSSAFTQYLNAQALYVSGRGPIPPNTRILLESFIGTLTWLRQNGFEPVVVAPPPRDGDDRGTCNARALLIGTSGTACLMLVEKVVAYDRATTEILTGVSEEFPVVDFTKYLCDAARCRSEDDGISLFENYGHFSARGSRHMGVALDFYRSLLDAAAAGCLTPTDDIKGLPRGICQLGAGKTAEKL